MCTGDLWTGANVRFWRKADISIYPTGRATLSSGGHPWDVPGRPQWQRLAGRDNIIRQRLPVAIHGREEPSHEPHFYGRAFRSHTIRASLGGYPSQRCNAPCLPAGRQRGSQCHKLLGAADNSSSQRFAVRAQFGLGTSECEERRRYGCCYVACLWSPYRLWDAEWQWQPGTDRP